MLYRFPKGRKISMFDCVYFFFFVTFYIGYKTLEKSIFKHVFRPISCLLAFHSTRIVDTLLQDGAILFLKTSNPEVDLSFSKCRRVLTFHFKIIRIITVSNHFLRWFIFKFLEVLLAAFRAASTSINCRIR